MNPHCHTKGAEDHVCLPLNTEPLDREELGSDFLKAGGTKYANAKLKAQFEAAQSPTPFARYA